MSPYAWDAHDLSATRPTLLSLDTRLHGTRTITLPSGFADSTPGVESVELSSQGHPFVPLVTCKVTAGQIELPEPLSCLGFAESRNLYVRDSVQRTAIATQIAQEASKDRPSPDDNDVAEPMAATAVLPPGMRIAVPDCAAQVCPPGYPTCVYVRDALGRAVEDVHIELTGKREGILTQRMRAATDSHGCAWFGGVSSGSYEVHLVGISGLHELGVLDVGDSPASASFGVGMPCRGLIHFTCMGVKQLPARLELRVEGAVAIVKVFEEPSLGQVRVSLLGLTQSPSWSLVASALGTTLVGDALAQGRAQMTDFSAAVEYAECSQLLLCVLDDGLEGIRTHDAHVFSCEDSGSVALQHLEARGSSSEWVGIELGTPWSIMSGRKGAVIVQDVSRRAHLISGLQPGAYRVGEAWTNTWSHFTVPEAAEVLSATVDVSSHMLARVVARCDPSVDLSGLVLRVHEIGEDEAFMEYRGRQVRGLSSHGCWIRLPGSRSIELSVIHPRVRLATPTGRIQTCEPEEQIELLLVEHDSDQR